MKNSAWNLTRRNRNIGTSNSGHSQKNKFVVPDRWSDFKVFWERLVSPIACPVTIKGHKLTILVLDTGKVCKFFLGINAGIHLNDCLKTDIHRSLFIRITRVI